MFYIKQGKKGSPLIIINPKKMVSASPRWSVMRLYKSWPVAEPY